MKIFPKKWIALSLSLLMAADSSSVLLAAETISNNPDTQKPQRVISFDPNAPAQKSGQTSQNENLYQSFGLGEENPLQPAAAEDGFDPEPIIQEMHALSTEILQVNDKMQNLSAHFEQLVSGLESKTSGDASLLESIRKAAEIYAEVRTSLEEKLSWIDPEGLIQRMEEIAQSEDGITPGDIEQFDFEKNIFRQWFEEVRSQVEYYEDEFDYVKAKAEGTAESWTRCESILNQIRDAAQSITEGLEAKKDAFSEFTQSENVFLAGKAKNIQDQITDTQSVISKRVAEAEAVLNTLLLSQNASAREDLVTSQLELIRQKFSEINAFAYSVQHYSEELIVYQDFNRQFNQILETALTISPALDAELSITQVQLKDVKLKMETLIQSPNLYIRDTAVLLVSQIDKILNKGGLPDLSLDEIYASQSITEASYHLERLQAAAKQYADEISKSLKRYQTEYETQSRFNEQFKPLWKKVTDSIKGIETKMPGLQERMRVLLQNFSALLKQNPEFSEISDFMKAIEQDQQAMNSDLGEAMKLMEKIKYAKSMGEASPMVLLIQELEKRFDAQGFYVKQINFKQQELSDYQALARPFAQARQQMKELRAVLEPLRNKILELLVELEDPKRFSPAVYKSLLGSLKEWRALASEIEVTLKEFQSGLDMALALRDAKALQAQSQKIKTKGALKTAKFQAQHEAIRQRVLLTLLLSGTFFKDWYLVIRLIA